MRLKRIYRPGSSKQSIRVEPSRSSPIVLEDPTLSQPSHPNTGVVCPPFIFGSVPARPSSSFEHQITTSFTSSASSASSTSSPAVNLHKCFDKSPTVFQYAQDIQIHNVNSQKTGYVLAKIWKIRCPECTNKNLINMQINSEFVVQRTKRDCIPVNAKWAFNCYLNGQSVTNHEIFKLPCVVQTVREITKLFFIELTLAIGEYMCKQVDTSVLYPFVMEYYENRNPMYTVVTKFGVEQNYEIMYTSLIPKLNPQL
uniref:Uncharacterized protein n=1 Tax=Panagrolaimus superbus TaxID=310955 RepID=A0A914YXQ6_9BILA